MSGIPSLCDCPEDGHCPRYQREMTGRLREICQGVNVDLGTAAAFRHQWAEEAKPAAPTAPPIPLLLKTDQMPGDAVAMTAAIYSLHRAHPGRYTTAVESPYPEVFAHNPDVVPATPDALPVRMHYPAVHRSNERGIHFMQGWCEFLSEALGVPVPLLTDRPRLYFKDPEPTALNWWVVCSGGTNNFTNKLWGYDNYQKVMRLLRSKVLFMQVGASGDDHPPLRGENVMDMTGTKSLRLLFDLIRRARGVLCGVSLPMHVAAALDRPAVVIAGGREPVAWNAYPRQQYVHTVGALPCTSTQGHRGRACWRSRVEKLNDGTWYDNDLCERPVDGIPECMRMITPEHVARLVLCYHQGVGSR